MRSNSVGRIASIRAMSRREMLRLTGGAMATALLGWIPWRLDAGAPSTGSPACVVRPEQTEGPYFTDLQLHRSDVRADPADGAVKQGVPLRLTLQVSRMDGKACTPLAGAVVDIWHCDAQGIYSGFEDFNGRFDTRGKQFLRGYQVTDAAGGVRFLTIYPGWYLGRTVHIHFKVRTDPAADRGLEFTSQLYFNDAITDRVHAQAPYAANGQRRTRNGDDGIFRRRGGGELMLPLTEDAQGYAGTFALGLRMT